MNQTAEQAAEQAAAVASRLAQVQSRITEAGGDLAKTQVLAVTKGFGPWAITAAAAAGLNQIGENYAQELLSKCRELPAPTLEQTQMHFIGHAQTNKVRLIAELVDVWQCVDRPSLVAEIAKRCGQATVMLQLNVSGAASQGGCAPEQAAELLSQATDAGLDVVGVMAIGAQGSPEIVRTSFEKAQRFADKHQLPQRSFGMSGDLEQAIAAGSTMLRIGTALFGQRPLTR